MYYAVQVKSRSEKSTILSIHQRVDKSLYSECFFPSREMNRKMHGKWTVIKEPLFPGYIFINSDQIKDLSTALIRIPEFAKVLGKDNVAHTFIPLSDREARVIDVLCGRETEYTAKLSYVEIKEGKIARIISGPLMGNEGKIKKVNLHRRQVLMSLDLFGRSNDILLSFDIIEPQN